MMTAMLYPGQLPSLRLNMHQAVLVLDLARPSSLQFLAGGVQSLVSRGFPVRWGVVPNVENEDGEWIMFIVRVARKILWG